MKCELIIKGLTEKQTFYDCCLQSVACRRWHDGTLHAFYHAKQYAREDAEDLKQNYPNLETTIETNLDGWVMVG